MAIAVQSPNGARLKRCDKYTGGTGGVGILGSNRPLEDTPTRTHSSAAQQQTPHRSLRKNLLPWSRLLTLRSAEESTPESLLSKDSPHQSLFPSLSLSRSLLSLSVLLFEWLRLSKHMTWEDLPLICLKWKGEGRSEEGVTLRFALILQLPVTLTVTRPGDWGGGVEWWWFGICET